MRKMRRGLAVLVACAGLLWAATAGAPSPPSSPGRGAGVLPQCQADLTTCNTDLGTCNTDLATCEASSFVPQTGQTTCWDNSGFLIIIPCVGTGHDGEFQVGTPLPIPRFTDNFDGTVTDNLTGLIWLQDANCPNTSIRKWQEALDDVASLNLSGRMRGFDCGDTSDTGSHQTDWRLPNVKELLSLIHYGFVHPALSDAEGTAQGTNGDPFTNIVTNPYLSSTTVVFSPFNAWAVHFSSGRTIIVSRSVGGHVLPVR